MTTAVLSLSRPWPRRLIDQAREGLLDRKLRTPTGHELDAIALRDLGIDASEIGSIHAEATGQAAPTRRRIVAGSFRG